MASKPQEALLASREDRAGRHACSSPGRLQGPYLAAHYQRIKGRRGHPKAVVAVAQSILVIVWHLLTANQPYSDLGGDYVVERQHREASKNRLIRQLERLRYKVTVEPANPT